MLGSCPSLFTAVVVFSPTKFFEERESHQLYLNLKISALGALQVLYFSDNMAATKQIIGETLLKRETTVSKPASPNPRFVSEQWGFIEHSLKCVLIEPAGHSLHCDGNVWLPVLH